MKKILLLDGGQKFGHSAGQLNDSLTDFAHDHLTASGHEVRQTRIAPLGKAGAPDAYDPEEEVEKILWADALIWQTPAWWMGVPWTTKKYMDDVFTAGHGRLYRNDGRTRSDPSCLYGSGGMLQGKKYMLSVTWNAPQKAFTDPKDFFEGKGVDGVYFPMHKAQQFLGMAPLPTFMLNDVIKDPQIEQDYARYKAHLDKVFPAHSPA
ncbi:NAD(P)H-dependent oxidoreductase [Oecophyllibacter saccharovorans]|uniref:Flavodoxin family protein n=1 Tax=Oecophyllibacter saccharovorans TaxID=2558360 RepID=A0A506UKS2_9PROT|nr:NAD(P)H-dependent oxidoreductase [Oecophyllibacter saccharovorans]QDH15973.1 flavodoxin family protein [Oecophyllibacter saccharovorans]TPW33920.1 flavodoxin family protein [Oecophyllibacter saccharovorans]TPW35407.1 flavodoxin family protein [Oecophyllibacter saccharovorans]